MLYKVNWAYSRDKVRQASSFATWGGVVVDASPAVQWLLGKRIEWAIKLLRERYAAEVVVVPDSYLTKEVTHGY